jgi:superoxide dismutase, Fe-Mn family
MKFLKKNVVSKVLTLLLFFGLLIAIVACTDNNTTEDKTTNTAISMSFDFPELDYSYDSLEPYIDAETMLIHHTKHFNSYTINLNAALEEHPELNYSIEELLTDLSLVPADIIRTAVQNNGGGYYNHALYFKILKVNNGEVPSGDLGAAIEQDFGSFTEFKETFENAAATHFGSGWAWLIVTDEGLKVVTTSNQLTTLSQGIPILCIDVCEHAYYLNYQNRRADYISAFFNVINWEKVTDLYEAAK